MSDTPLTIDEPELPVDTGPPDAGTLDVSTVPVPWAPEEVEAYRSYDPAGASLQELGDIGRVFAKSGFFKDARDAAQCITKILAGREELGLGPFQAMSGFHVVEGKPTMSAGLVGALVKRSARYDYLPKTWTDSECILEWYQDRELVGESSFSQADATRAGLWGKGAWRTYPKAMVFNRALTAGARMYCPDVFGGAIYTPDELGA